MSYRSDHDAALARVDALESELATLRRHEPPPPPAAPERPRAGWKLAFGVLAAGLMVAIGAAVAAGKAEEQPPAGRTTAVAADVRAELDFCAHAAVRLDASCRALIDGLATDVYTDPDLRAAVGAWGEADRELAAAGPTDDAARGRALTHRADALHGLFPLL